MEKIIAYKGFGPDLTCRGFQFEVGKEYDLEGVIVICWNGFHACRLAADVFKYYPPYKANGLTRYCIVEISGNIQEEDDKICGSHIKILEEISLKDIIREATDPERILGKCGRDTVAANTKEQSIATNRGWCSIATNTGGQSVAANTGQCSVVTNTGGQSVAANTGRCSIAAIDTGWYSIAANTARNSVAINAARNSVAINTGEASNATSLGVDSAAINTGHCSWSLAEGLHSVALSTGTKSKAKVTESNSIAIVTGENGCACGVLGSWLVLTEREGARNEISDVRVVKVDGKKILPGTWYALKKGKVVMPCNDN